MKMRARAEAQIIKGLNENRSIQDVYLNSPASPELTNAILAQILNHQSHLNAIKMASVCCPILRAKAA
jgi:hypothetical protein